MLIYSEDRLVPTDVNMMVIRGKHNVGFFYIHRSLYDQAVIINDIYEEEPKLLIKALTGKEESRADVDKFLEEVPVPLNIFGPYLLLITEEIEELEDMIGAIHVMSGPLNLRKMLKIPFEMRNTPTFSLSIKEEYQVAWDRFFQTTMPYSMDMWRPKGISPMNGVQTETIPTGEAKTEEEEMEELEDVLFNCGDDFFDADDEEMAAITEEIEARSPAVQEQEDKEVEKSVAVRPDLVSFGDEPEPVEEAPKDLSGIDLLLAGGGDI